RPAVAAQGTRIDVPIRERESSSRALDGHIARTASAGHTARRARSATRRARSTTRRAGNTRSTAGVARHQPAGAVVVVVARALAVIASGACHEAQGKRCQAKANQSNRRRTSHGDTSAVVMLALDASHRLFSCKLMRSLARAR